LTIVGGIFQQQYGFFHLFPIFTMLLLQKNVLSVFGISATRIVTSNKAPAEKRRFFMFYCGRGLVAHLLKAIAQSSCPVFAVAKSSPL
jgi:hypothetical protein